MEKKNGIVSALTNSVKTKKHITTKIEYFCNDTMMPSVCLKG